VYCWQGSLMWKSPRRRATFTLAGASTISSLEQRDRSAASSYT
jgi:hypothetical protein